MALENRFGGQDTYTKKLLGAFGRFQVGQSFPMDYLLTSMTIDQLHTDLTFARDLGVNRLDFELMMQRDIDEARVKEKIVPYLAEQAAYQVTRPLFFPPLLIAIMPVEDGMIQETFADWTLPEHEAGEIQFESRGHVKLTVHAGEGSKVFAFGNRSWKIDHSQVLLELALTRGNERGVRLVVIDGQHRLLALKQLQQAKYELVKNLLVPTCILLPPSCTDGNAAAHGDQAPRVVEIFRRVFVDVNTTAEAVGGHFTILLSDRKLSELTCRLFCESTVTHHDIPGIAAIEWNIKTKKNATIINRAYSLTSIGIIEKALSEIQKKRRVLKFLIKYGEVESALNPPDKSEDEYPPFTGENFSLAQRRTLEEQLGKTLCSFLDRLYFHTPPFSTAFELYQDELRALGERIDATEDTDERHQLMQCRSSILNSFELDESKYGQAIAERDRLQFRIENARRAAGVHIASYALFQRGVFFAFGELAQFCLDSRVSPDVAEQLCLNLLMRSFVSQGVFWRETQRYMTPAIFEQGRIRTKETTRKAIAYLILAQLGGKERESWLFDKISLPEPDKRRLAERLVSAGHEAASLYVEHYQATSEAFFKANYRVMGQLSDEQKDRLIEAEEEFSQQVLEVRVGQREKDKVSGRFSALVRNFVLKDIALVSSELKNALQFDVDIVATGEPGRELDTEDEQTDE